MNAIEAQAYTITLKRKVVDGEDVFVGRVAELPDVAVYEDTRQVAYAETVNTIIGLHCMAQEDGRSFPAPFADEEEYSGRFTVRVPKFLHRNLAQTAEREGASFNQYILSVLAKADGASAARNRHIGDTVWLRVAANSGFQKSFSGVVNNEANDPVLQGDNNSRLLATTQSKAA